MSQERRMAVLSAIVEDYVQTSEPVGSRAPDQDIVVGAAEEFVVARAAGELHDLAGHRRWHVDDGLGGFHGNVVVVEADHVAFLDVPLDDGGIGQAFAEVESLHRA